MASIPATTFTLFPLLPLEIRRKIWFLTLPGPRCMLVTINHYDKAVYQTNPVSYGGHHPAALHTNSESRTEALLHLVLRWRAYWNLKLDSPYIEATDASKRSNAQFGKMTRSGELEGFENVAVDWTVWNWKSLSNSMEFRASLNMNKFKGYEHPLESVAKLPHLKNCTFIYTKHTQQRSLLVPYGAWRIGPLDARSTLDENGWETVAMIGPPEIKQKYAELSQDRVVRELVSSPHPNENFMIRETKVSGVEINPQVRFRIKAIHGRKREFLPAEKMYRPQAGWEMDWFG